MQTNISASQALATVLTHVRALEAEVVPLDRALGRTLAQNTGCPLDLPPFDNSAMDGYAVRSDDLIAASANAPARLRCSATRPAKALADGEEQMPLKPGECVRIMTGAPVPPGANAVVMREECVAQEHEGVKEHERHESIAFSAPCKPGQNIRRRGEDIREGEVAVEAGTRLRAAEIGLLAACGLGSIPVARQPRVGLIATGDELLSPGEPRREGQIYDSNSWALRALLAECGAQLKAFERTGDEPGEFSQALRRIAGECDLIVTSGGVSAGDFDPVRDVLLDEAQVHFWKVAIKPAKPVMFATLACEDAEGERALPIFGLPGNPVSVAVAFELFVRPALLRMQGRRLIDRTRVTARVDGAGRSPEGKEEYVRAWVSPDERGIWHARVSGHQSSGRLTTMTRANALLVVPPHVTSYERGDEFAAMMTDWPES
jgi:molybdopterin molybdotransferase